MHLDKGAVPAGTQVVEGACEDTLSRSRLAEEEDSAIGRSRLLGQAKRLLEGLTVPHDLDRVVGELSIQVCPVGTSYVFNPSGQVIDASGLLALYDREGPTGTPVKDAQRTKTHDGTRTTLSIVWGSNRLPGRTNEATTWYRQLVASIPGATLEDVTLR